MNPTSFSINDVKREPVFPSPEQTAYLSHSSPTTAVYIEGGSCIFGDSKRNILEWDFKNHEVLWKTRLGRSESGMPLYLKKITAINDRYCIALDSSHTTLVIDRKDGISQSLGKLGTKLWNLVFPRSLIGHGSLIAHQVKRYLPLTTAITLNIIIFGLRLKQTKTIKQLFSTRK
jgi:hypothetical protein